MTRSGVWAVVRRPWLWGVALRLAPDGWWRRKPYLPLPDAGYLRFRMMTMYGDATHAAEPADLVTYLEWCRRFRAGRRYLSQP